MRFLCMALVALTPWLGFSKAQAQTSAPGQNNVIVALGDSLTAGYGLPGDAAFPVQLEKALQSRGLNWRIDNAGVSGDTMSAGRDRLDWSVPDGTRAVILELGANDALRGIDPAVTRAALEDILKKLKARNIPVLVAGMKAPPNMGADYAAKFDGMYADLAAQYGAALYPFFLDGVAADTKLNQSDGIHPTAEGVRLIVARMLPAVETFLAGLPPAKS